MALQTPTRRNLESISKKVRDTKLKIKDLIVPIAVTIILILIAVFVFVPMITKAQEYRAELRQVKEKQNQLDNLLVSLQKVSDDELQKDLVEVKSVIPRTLKVSSFLFYIDELAKQKNLRADSISAGDINLTPSSTTGEEQTEGDGYKGVNGPLNYTGSLENVLSFLDSFYTSSPYIVSPTNITLERAQTDWEVRLNLTGFYITEDDEYIFNPYKPFKAYTEFPEIMETLRDKARRLNSPVL